MASIIETIKQNFQKATTTEYWHHLMIVRSQEGSFDVNKIASIIQQIEKRTGEANRFDRQVKGLTPLHVAAALGNKPGLIFLLNQGVPRDVKDNQGMTPKQYCAQFHPELLGYFESTEKSSTKTLMSEVLTPYKQTLSASSFTYQKNTDDFGCEIVELLFMKSESFGSKEKTKHFVDNIQHISKEEGFKVRFTSSGYCSRDLWIRDAQGQFFLPSDRASITSAIQRSSSKSLVFRDTAIYCTDHECFSGTMGAALQIHGHAMKDFEQRYGPHLERCLRFYIEGGNMFLLSNTKGELKLCIGKDLLTVIHLQLRTDKLFDDPAIDLNIQTTIWKRMLNRDAILKILEEMYALGCFKPKKGCEKGLISKEEIDNICSRLGNQWSTYSASANPYLEIAKELGYFEPLNLSDAAIEALSVIAARFQAERDFVKTWIGKSLGVSSLDVHFVPQLDYHLDVFLHPGPKGSFFIQDYELCCHLLSRIEECAQSLHLTPRDLALLHRYQRAAQTLNAQLKPLAEEAKKELLSAGFQLIPTPGIFFDVSHSQLGDEDAKTYNLNFLNAITGWSSQTHHYYYITTGAQVGDKLGHVLMEYFREFLESYQPGIEVYYIGYDPANPSDFSEGMQWNQLGVRAGPHCMSKELETRSHQG